MIDFEKIENATLDLAHAVGLSPKNKSEFRKAILDMVVGACYEYEKHAEFKQDIDNYYEQRLIEENSKG